MPDVLMLLCPPRSFSSVISTMIGQHPQMYGFPELHLVMGDTVEDVMEYERGRGKNLGPPGLLRTLAELDYGGQTSAGVLEANAWLQDKPERGAKQVFDRVIARAEAKTSARVMVEKTPAAALNPKHLERAYAFYPRAWFLHVTRHPINTKRSLDEAREFKEQHRVLSRKEWKEYPESLTVWAWAHRNILDFTDTLPPGQSMRIRGEDVLNHPDRFLPQIAEWLGLSTEAAAIEAMKHPEASPYVGYGPPAARGGNDGKFMQSPHLRVGAASEGNLRASLRGGDLDGQFEPEAEDYLLTLANRLGYQ